MSKRNELTLFLGFRLHDSAAGTLRRLESLLEEIADLEAGTRIPLHWNVPLYPLFAGSSRPLHDLITEIKGRVRSRGDVLAPAGFRGALHPLLDDHELERELSWCRRNPWIPGFRELLGQEPELTIPIAPDLPREAAVGAYSSAGFHAVGLPLPPPGTPVPHRRQRRGRHRAGMGHRDLVLSRGAGRATIVSASLLSLADLAEDSPALAALAASTPPELLLLLDLPGHEDTIRSGDRPVSRLLEALSYRRSLHPAALSPELLAASGSGASHPGVPHPAAARPVGEVAPSLAALLHESAACPLLEAEAGILPASRQEAARAYRRSGRRRNEDTRKALEILAPGAGSDQARRPSPGPARGTPSGLPGQILFAEMGGNVSLPGPKFAAHFFDGRLRGFSTAGREAALPAPAQSWFTFGRDRCALGTLSAASFERDGDHGLATSLAAEIPGGKDSMQVLVETFFREGEPELFLDCSLRFPQHAPPLGAAVPYELPLFRFPEAGSPELLTEMEGGTVHRERIPPAEGFLLACGRRIRLALEGTEVALTAIEAGEAAPVTVIPLRVCRESGRWSLRACLGGRTCGRVPLPVAGLISRLSFRIGLEET